MAFIGVAGAAGVLCPPPADEAAASATEQINGARRSMSSILALYALLLLLPPRLLPDAVGVGGDGGARLFARLLPAARDRLCGHRPRRARAEPLLALRAAGHRRLRGRRRRDVLDRAQGGRARSVAAGQAFAPAARAGARRQQR